MMIPGEISKKGGHYAAIVEGLGAYGQGKTRKAACDQLARQVLEIAAGYRPLEGFTCAVRDDGDATCYLTADDSARLLATFLRRQREMSDMSLADVAEKTGAKSRNGYAQIERGENVPTLGKLAELLEAIAPRFELAIVPKTAQVLPRWDEEAGDETEIDELLGEPRKVAKAAR